MRRQNCNTGDMKKSILPVALIIAGAVALSQGPGPGGSRQDRFKTMSEQAEKKGLAEPFKGVTTDGTAKPGLFAIKSTGVSTEPVRKAADALLVVGSSLMVFSGYRFCRMAAASGKPIAAINAGKTRADDLLYLKLELPAQEVLPRLVDLLSVPAA